MTLLIPPRADGSGGILNVYRSGTHLQENVCGLAWVRCERGVCAILLRLYTSTERLKKEPTQAPGHFWEYVISDKLWF
jgi:hypothetical protein